MPDQAEVPPKNTKVEAEHVATDGAELQEEHLKPTTPLGKFIFRVSQVMAAIGALSLFAMVIVTVIDVGGRDIFLKPLNGAFELVGIMLVIAGTWGMGYCQILKMNIRIGLFAERFPKKGQDILWILTLLVGSVVTVLVAWQSLVKTGDLFTAKLGNLTDTLAWPLWPFWFMMAIGYVWAAFVFLVELYQNIGKVLKR